ncbi:FadR family transcriptional regulator [Deinococcus irradiatisoli]|uniref:FadR family transcriptional regulator n=1 Tax=Deinococcus irradiatisoli TaxID=2202254 RepID=A0A2Z3JL18_9DEIO|nr:FadR/GntR family transcriptional regulator [Deinococcus irradiatisoli]AWN24241.1 FadR family transcriptional regulator [Deinococcus irradiatisoli]
MTASPIKRQKLTDSVVAELLSLIVRGGFEPGQRLPPERQLAEEMGVSRSSLRDAVARLEVLGHLAVRQGDGIFVRQPSAANLCLPFTGLLTRLPQSARDLLEFRQLIEPGVAALAAERATPESVQLLLGGLEQQRRTAGRGIKLTEEDLQFHALIAQMAGNEVLTLILGTLQHLLHSLRDHDLPGDQPQLTIEQHTEIAQAIAAGSPETARQAMSRHLESVIFTASQTLAAAAVVPALPSHAKGDTHA